jgi:hypothetical protein
MSSKALAVLGALLTLSASMAAQKGTSYVARLFVDDGTNYSAARVLPVGDAWYSDYRLPDGDACVAGSVFSTGELGVFLNRRMPSGLLCHDTPVGNGGGIGRAYTLLFDDAEVCALFPSAQPLDGGGCAYTTPVDQPKSIEMGAIFKNKVTKTNVTLYFNEDGGFNEGGMTYRLTTDTPADVVPAGNTRIVTHAGSATLSIYQAWPDGYVPFKSITLPFRMQIDRVAVTSR